MGMGIDREKMNMDGNGLPADFETIHFIALNSNLYDCFFFCMLKLAKKINSEL